MRKISAHYIFTATGAILSKGIISVTNEGVIAEITDTHGNLEEMANVEFYSGVITPGFVNAYCHTELPGRQNSIPEINKFTLVHNIHTTQNEINLFEKSGVLQKTWFVICPDSILHREEGLPDPELFGKDRHRICLGTDSLSANPNLSILEVMKNLQANFPDLPFEDMVTWATYHGAKAMGTEQLAGSIEKGKKPGLNLITGMDLQQLILLPHSKVKKLT